MIYIALQGGLGNQMFQLAAAKALALQHKTKIKLVLAAFEQEESKTFTKRTFELGSIFDLRDIEVANFKEHAYFTKNNLHSKIKRNLLSSCAFYEHDLSYQSNFKRLPKNTFLNGYFQSERYFQKYKREILELFSFNKPCNAKTADAKENIKHQNALAIHIRRGDYATKKNTQQKHGLLTLIYYKKALEKFDLHEHRLYVFSDDMPWVKENFANLTPVDTVFVDWNSGQDAWQDLYLMTLCSDFIIANSSFSWWGAWLAENPNKKILAPKNWFKNEKFNSLAAELVPESWERIG